MEYNHHSVEEEEERNQLEIPDQDNGQKRKRDNDTNQEDHLKKQKYDLDAKAADTDRNVSAQNTTCNEEQLSNFGNIDGLGLDVITEAPQREFDLKSIELDSRIDQLQQSKVFDYGGEDIDDDLICSICSKPFIDPRTHNLCGYTFCYDCVNGMQNCPKCGNDFNNDCIQSAKVIQSLLDKLKVKCSMCKNKVSRGALKTHQETDCALLGAYKQVEELKQQVQRENEELKMKLENGFNEMSQQLKKEYEELNEKLKVENEQDINEAKANLCLKEYDLIQRFKLKEEEFEKQTKEFENEKLTRQKFETSNKPIHLNVGGTIVTVSLGDFIHNEREPENLFKKMFNKEYPLYETQSNAFKDAVYFINCKPVIFEHILEWLKFGSIDRELNDFTKNSLLNTSIMFGLKKLEDQLNQINIYQKEKVKITQLDFVKLTDLSRSQKTPIFLSFNDLRGLVLQNTVLDQSEIVSCELSGMNLKDANFNRSILRRCNFSGCDLTCVNFRDCDLSVCNFSNCILKNTDMSNANLSYASFENAQFEETKLISCNLSNNDFSRLKFKNVNFSNTNVDECNFENSLFENCIIQTHLKKNNNLKDCKLIECTMNGSIFEEIDFKFIESNLLTTLFDKCTFKNLDLSFLKSLTKFKGNKFDSCSFNFEEFTEKKIEFIQFENIDFKSLNLNDFEFNNCETDGYRVVVISSSIILDIGPLISSALYSNTNSQSIPQLLYRGTRDGFKAQDFHSKCDNQGPTLTIIKSEHNQIFGAFTTQSWKSPQQGDECMSDSSAFIFKITNSNGNHVLQKFNITKKEYGIVVNNTYLPIFGDGHDICIESDCNLNNDSYSNFGSAYELPKELENRSDEAKRYLAGSENFKVVEIEVFKVYQ